MLRLIHRMKAASVVTLMVTLMAGLTCVPATAAPRFDIDTPEVIAEVDGVIITTASVDIIHRLVKRKTPDIDRSALLRGLIENRVIAARAQTEFTDEALGSGSQTRVGFPADVVLMNARVNALRQVYQPPLQHSVQMLRGGSLDGTINFLATFDDRSLSDRVTLNNTMEYRMTAAQQLQAEKTVVGRFQLPAGAEQSVTLWDIYRRQNVQGRIAIHNRDTDFLQQQIRRYVMQAYVLDWVRRHSGLTSADLVSLERLLADKRLKEQYLTRKGLLVDIHDNNAALKTLAATVTADEIRDYYTAHKQDFVTIEKVRAQHLRVSTQADADRVYRHIAQGLDFEEAIRRYSISKDKSWSTPGDLGWIHHQDRKNAWLKGITFVQPVGKVSKPFRSPQVSGQNVYWEIVRVSDRQTGYQSVDSEGVRYQAAQALARDKAVEQFNRSRLQWMDAANIRLNPSLVNHRIYQNSATRVEFLQKNTHQHAH